MLLVTSIKLMALAWPAIIMSYGPIGCPIRYSSVPVFFKVVVALFNWEKGTSHDEYLRLGHGSEERCDAYRELFKHQLNAADLHLIRKASHYSQPIGDDRFRIMIEEKYEVKIGPMKRGWPKKEDVVG